MNKFVVMWVVNFWIQFENEEIEESSLPNDNYYVETLQEAEKIKEQLLAGQHEYYGNMIKKVHIEEIIQEI